MLLTFDIKCWLASDNPSFIFSNTNVVTSIFWVDIMYCQGCFIHLFYDLDPICRLKFDLIFVPGNGWLWFTSYLNFKPTNMCKYATITLFISENLLLWKFIVKIILNDKTISPSVYECFCKNKINISETILYNSIYHIIPHYTISYHIIKQGSHTIFNMKFQGISRNFFNFQGWFPKKLGGFLYFRMESDPSN